MPTDNSSSESAFDSAKRAFADTASSFTDRAAASARDYAAQGKDRTVEALDNVATLVTDAANQVSEKLGEQYGGYIQRAADAVSGLATTLRNKEADELVDDARDVIRSSPAVAIAAATAVGFLLARVVKSGFTPKTAEEGEPDITPVAPVKPKPAKAASAKPVAKAAPAPKAAPVSEAPATPTSDNTPPTI